MIIPMAVLSYLKSSFEDLYRNNLALDQRPIVASFFCVLVL